MLAPILLSVIDPDEHTSAEENNFNELQVPLKKLSIQRKDLQKNETTVI